MQTASDLQEVFDQFIKPIPDPPSIGFWSYFRAAESGYAKGAGPGVTVYGIIPTYRLREGWIFASWRLCVSHPDTQILRYSDVLDTNSFNSNHSRDSLLKRPWGAARMSPTIAPRGFSVRLGQVKKSEVPAPKALRLLLGRFSDSEVLGKRKRFERDTFRGCALFCDFDQLTRRNVFEHLCCVWTSASTLSAWQPHRRCQFPMC